MTGDMCPPAEPRRRTSIGPSSSTGPEQHLGSESLPAPPRDAVDVWALRVSGRRTFRVDAVSCRTIPDAYSEC